MTSKPSGRPCAVVDCLKLARNRGWCSMHYERWRLHGDVGPATLIREVPKPECCVEGCTRTARCQDYCSMHYQRVWKTGSPRGANHEVITRGDLLTRLSDKFLVGDGCWPWVGVINGNGYGMLGTQRGHVLLFELMVGPVPRGFHVHHLCQNRRCVRPDHLAALSHKDHMAVHAALVTHCKWGHDLSDTGWYYRNNGGRECRMCCIERSRRANDKQRA